MNGLRSLDLKSGAGGRAGEGGSPAGQLLDGVEEGGGRNGTVGRCSGSGHGSLHVSSSDSEPRLIAAAAIASNVHTLRSACSSWPRADAVTC